MTFLMTASPLRASLLFPSEIGLLPAADTPEPGAWSASQRQLRSTKLYPRTSSTLVMAVDMFTTMVAFICLSVKIKVTCYE